MLSLRSPFAKRPGSVTLRSNFADQLEPLEEAVTERHECLKVCRARVRELIEAVLNEDISKLVTTRDAGLEKVVPFEAEIQRLETLKRESGIGCMSSRVLGVARWLAHE